VVCTPGLETPRETQNGPGVNNDGQDVSESLPTAGRTTAHIARSNRTEDALRASKCFSAGTRQARLIATAAPTLAVSETRFTVETREPAGMFARRCEIPLISILVVAVSSVVCVGFLFALRAKPG
jgi:hypothetical protein